jgi:hypothetical protein
VKHDLQPFFIGSEENINFSYFLLLVPGGYNQWTQLKLQ